MGYRVMSFRSRDNESREFEEAAMMAKEGIEKMCDLAEEMRERYSERRSGNYGSRGGYGRRGYYGSRDEEWDEMDEMRERRRNSRGQYM